MTSAATEMPYPVVENFDDEKYLGTWYEAYRSKSFTFGKGECTTAHYSRMDGGYIRVFNSDIAYKKQTIDKTNNKANNNDVLENKRSFASGWARWENPERKQGTLGVKFSIFQPSYAYYDILDTDYDSFAYVFSGAEKGCIFNGYRWVWILTRKPLTKDSEEHRKIYHQAKNFLEKHLEDFNFDDEMRYTLQGETDTPGAVYFTDEQQLNPPKDLVGPEVTPFTTRE